MGTSTFPTDVIEVAEVGGGVELCAVFSSTKHQNQWKMFFQFRQKVKLPILVLPISDIDYLLHFDSHSSLV